MKKSVVTILLVAASAAWGQSIPVAELVGPNNLLRDPVYGVSLTFPAGWEVRGGARWGKNNKENTIALKPIWPLESVPSVYYQPRSNFEAPEPGREEAHFRHTAATKAQQRISGGLTDYRNLEDTFTFTLINGRPAFRYVAKFTRNGKPHFEYFTRVLGDELMVMFFVQGPWEELDAIRQACDQMSATVQVP
jgi:hypothetical protein